MLLRLTENSEVLMSSFKSKLRSQIKKPIKLGDINLLDDFYSWFSEHMLDFGSPVHSKKWFAKILKNFGERAILCLAYGKNNLPQAGGMILCHDRVVSIPWACTLKRFNRCNPNMLLYWTLLQYAADNGYQFFDFGRSTPGMGTYKFKAQWGAIAYPMYWNRTDTTSSIFIPQNEQYNGQKDTNSKARRYKEKVFQGFPVSMATVLGSRLRRYVSLYFFVIAKWSNLDYYRKH